MGSGGDAANEDDPQFFTPPYLRTSRYVHRLRQAYLQHVTELQERAQRNSSMHRHQSSLSSSPSMTSLNKLNTHRGVAQDVIERFPPLSREEPRPYPLPYRLNDEDKYSALEIMADGTELRLSGSTMRNTDEAATARADWPMPKDVGIFYYEVTILSRGKDGMIGIGFSSQKASLNRLPGWEPESWAYHGDDGFVFTSSSSGKAYGPHFSSQDVIGCGVNFRTKSAFFTKNGQYLGTAFTNITTERLFPSVGIKKPGEHLRMNFGRTPFVFDIERLVNQERENIQNEIKKTSVAELHPPDDENALIQKLIGHYLAHEGYIDTARAFTQDIEVQQHSLSTQNQPYRISNEDDINATQRQRIRKSILDGDIDKALKYSSTYYPHLFDQDRNRDIYFRLRCRKFVEMMRRHAELVNAAYSPVTVTKSVASTGSNGHAGNDGADTEDDEPPDTQMELDDQLHRETSNSLEPSANNDDVDMDASEELPSKRPYMKADELLTAAVLYGQELQQEWKSDQREHVKKRLQEIFAVMAYQNLNASPISHLFEVQGRNEIAEEVNGAILGELPWTLKTNGNLLNMCSLSRAAVVCSS